MYTTISGIYENGQVILQESAPTEKSMKVLVVFVGENNQASSIPTPVKQVTEEGLKQHFSERWQGQFKLGNSQEITPTVTVATDSQIIKKFTL